ncbi:tetratricopeptide repeat protein [Kibdelosporangium lantanae]|uniref:Tetratricopeptide repeat protein n=1 Tax=Kibdelosporangium lantanae TaxID=1497396 RepID=A0ABW3M379_9PSEU
MEQPFDARKVMWDDVDQPTVQRRTVSLITALREAVVGNAPERAPEDPQVEDLRRYIDELTSRGIDGDSLVRYGLFQELMAGILMRTLPYWIPLLRGLGSAAGGSDTGNTTAVDSLSTRTWAGLIGPLISAELTVEVPVDATLETLLPLLNRLADKVYPWVLTAPIDDLLTLRPPTAEELEAVGSTPFPDVTTLKEYRWIGDRFAVTHLDDWTTSSLRREYNWRAGAHSSPCPETLMNDRSVIAEDLNAEMARRLAVGEPTAHIGGHVGLEQALLGRLRSNAIRLLQQNRTREAAALFEFAVNENPHDPELVNNLGFCLIPHDPRKALARLEEAARLGYARWEINLHNRALCKLLLGEYQTSLEMICAQWGQVRGESAMLWRHSSRGLRLQTATTSRDELAHLAHRAAIFLNDNRAIQHWSSLAGIPADPD